MPKAPQGYPIFLRIARERYEYTRGAFALVEMLVAVGVFMVLMVGLVGAYITLLGGSNRARTQQETIDTVRAAVEHIDRMVRRADLVVCGNQLPPTYVPVISINCPQGGDSLALLLDRRTGEQVVFRFMDDGTGRVALFRSQDGEFMPLVSSRLHITKGLFRVVEGSSETAPRVTVLLQGFVEDPKEGAREFSLQTTIAPPLSYQIPEEFGRKPPSGEGVVQCVFNNKPGYIIPPAGAQNKVLPTQGVDATLTPYNRLRTYFVARARVPYHTAPFVLPEDKRIPAGTYPRVFLQGWDEHCNPKKDPRRHDPANYLPCSERTTFVDGKYDAKDVQPYEKMIVALYACKTPEFCQQLRSNPQQYLSYDENTGKPRYLTENNLEVLWVSNGDAPFERVYKSENEPFSKIEELKGFSLDVDMDEDYRPYHALIARPTEENVRLSKPVDLIVFYHAGFYTDDPRASSGRAILHYEGEGENRRLVGASYDYSYLKVVKRRCGFESGKPKTPNNYTCFEVANSDGVVRPWVNYYSVVPACFALASEGAAGSDVGEIYGEPF